LKNRRIISIQFIEKKNRQKEIMASAAYDFSQQPQAVPSKNRTKGGNGNGNAKYRENEGDENIMASNNIMFDNRVVRGNTYAAQVITQEQQRQEQVYDRNDRARNARNEDRRMQNMPPPGTPPAVAGRSHMEIQTVS
jgi:hypothetical protein